MGDVQGVPGGGPLLPTLWLGVTRAARTAPATALSGTQSSPQPAAPYLSVTLLCPQPPTCARSPRARPGPAPAAGTGSVPRALGALVALHAAGSSWGGGQRKGRGKRRNAGVNGR